MFKAGDKVRCIDAEGTTVVSFGKEYEVAEVDGEYLQVLVDGSERGMYAHRFELVEQPWQPKVGDRVRYSDDCVTGIGEVDSQEDNGWLVKVDGKDRSHAYFNGSRWFSASSLSPLPVAEQPAAIEIEAGKFYRTRDGRKVGPMRKWDDDSFDVSVGDGRLWRPDGLRYYRESRGDSDLIAEWADEPATAPATPVAATASNDNAAPAKPAKFKVGDRVTGRDCCDNPISGTITSVDESDKDIPYSIEGRWCRETDINLASTVAPQQSTAGFTIPLVDDEAANDNTLTVTLTADASDLHEELDEIIAKLKKIRKLQRQTGLAA